MQVGGGFSLGAGVRARACPAKVATCSRFGRPRVATASPEDQDPTNFSYVQWSDIAAALDLKLNKASLTESNDPRFR